MSQELVEPYVRKGVQCERGKTEVSWRKYLMNLLVAWANYFA